MFRFIFNSLPSSSSIVNLTPRFVSVSGVTSIINFMLIPFVYLDLRFEHQFISYGYYHVLIKSVIKIMN